MPLCPQITNTPTVLPREVAITAVSYTTTTATYTASGHTFIAGNVVVITGLLPAGYNGTFTISSVSGSTTFTVSNSTNAALTDQSGLATPGGDYVIASVLPVVAATTTQVNTAQATATSALADATLAYNKAVGSLQPSASTIVNASNQMTAIAANGITVYSGSSATSGARVVMNSVGLAGYNSAGSATFSITAATGAAVFSGSITGSSITGSTLNINGNAIIDASGYLTASGATLTGTVNATSGYIGSTSTGWQFTSSGYLYSADTILYPTTSPGGQANTYSIFTGCGIYADRILVTNTQAAAVYSSGGLYALGALNVAASGGTPLFAVNTSGSITAVVDIAQTGSITGNTGITSTGTITSSGNIITNNHFYTTAASTTGNAANAFINTGSTPVGRIMRSTASSIRYKENITDIRNVAELDPKKMLDIPVRAFSYKSDYLSNDDRAETLIPGLIAEEVDAIYPLAADYVGGQVESINDRAILVNLLALVQDLYKEIAIIKGE